MPSDFILFLVPLQKKVAIAKPCVDGCLNSEMVSLREKTSKYSLLSEHCLWVALTAQKAASCVAAFLRACSLWLYG